MPVFEERVIGVAVGQWASASADFLVTLRDIAGTIYVGVCERLCARVFVSV